MPWVEPITRRAAWVVIAAAVIAFLSYARDFVLPLALAILFAFMLSPVVRWLNRRTGSRIASVAIACVIGGAVVASITAGAALQFLGFAEDLPQYRHTIAKKIITMKGSGDGVIGRTLKAIADIEQDVEKAATTAPAKDALQLPAIPVVQKDEQSLLESTKQIIEPVVEPILITAIVVVLVFLLLYYGEELRDRVVVLAGIHQLTVTSQALEDANRRIGRYLLMQASINTFFGICIGIGLMIIGIPNAIFLGIIAGLFRFVPILGAWIGAALPMLMALAVFDNWTPVLYVIALFVFFEAFVNFVLEPYFYGHSTGISGIAVVVAILFWTWIWGPIGLLLAVPLTVCLVVLGKYIQPLRVFYILLTDEPMLAGERRLYHRLVSGDVPAAETLVRNSIETQGIAQTADTLLLPVLEMAHADYTRGTLSDDRLQLVNDSISDFADDFVLPDSPADPQSDANAKNSLPVIAFVPAAESDRAAARITSSAASAVMKAAVILLDSSMHSDVVREIESRQVSTLVLVCVNPESAARARLLAKSLNRTVKQTRILMIDPGNFMGESTSPHALRFTSVQKLIATLGPVSGRATPDVSVPTPHTLPAAGI